MTPELLTLDEVADVFGLSVITMRRWAQDGRLPVITLPSGHYRVRRDDLNQMLQSAQADPAR